MIILQISFLILFFLSILYATNIFVLWGGQGLDITVLRFANVCASYAEISSAKSPLALGFIKRVTTKLLLFLK